MLHDLPVNRGVWIVKSWQTVHEPDVGVTCPGHPICGPFPCEMISSCRSAIGARWSHATRTLAHWFSTVIGWPRRSSAFPPRATTTLMPTPTRAMHPAH